MMTGNYAGVQGGAIYANGFKSIKISKKSKLSNNLAFTSGDDFYMSNTEDNFELKDVTISNPMARNSIHAESIGLILDSVRMTDIR